MSHFFAYLSRMKLIERWALMQNNRKENVQEHSLQVAMFAHALALIKNKKFNGKVNPERVAILAIFHDASEVITGDMPTPVKYFSDEMKSVFKEIESHAADRLVDLLDEELKEDYQSLLKPQDNEREHWALVKAADTLSAYVKCLEEAAAGNKEFNLAKESIEQKIKEIDSPEVSFFFENYISSFSLTLDEMSIR